MGSKKKAKKAENLIRNLALLKALGFEAQQMKCVYQYKDKNLLFYPTTGVYFDEYTRETGLISDLPPRNTLIAAIRPVVGKYGKLYDKNVWLFHEFALPKNQLPKDDQLHLQWF